MAASSYSLFFARPDPHLFHLPPFNSPPILPPTEDIDSLSLPTWRHPFPIPATLYARALDARVPLTIASVYAATAVLLNKYNTRRNFRPWRISRTLFFKAFVILHNVFLAAYSAWTFAGMCSMLNESIPSWHEYTGPGGGGWKAFAVAVVDVFTHINGAKGLGNVNLYDHAARQWISLNPSVSPMVLSPEAPAVPSPVTPGRFWNAGLAYFGWLFYISKFYEVLDTLIILAKGKKSSTLQTYHHAGAMLCMWAGIRYAAAPIWIFPTFNSLIHALMYTYYTLSAVHIPVPIAVKRSLTTMQILQFILGTALAGSYLFIKYSFPLPAAAAAAAAAIETPISSASASAASTAQPVAAAASSGFSSFLKNILGLTHQHSSEAAVHFDKTTSAVAAAATQAIKDGVDDTVYSTYTLNGVDTPGQAFAVWLNVVYLLPLTWLFARFFVRSYIRRPGMSTTAAAANAAAQTAQSAMRTQTQRDAQVAEKQARAEKERQEELRRNLAVPAQQAQGDEQPPQQQQQQQRRKSFLDAELAGLDALRRVGREIRRFPDMQDGTVDGDYSSGMSASGESGNEGNGQGRQGMVKKAGRRRG